jgi:hypothetical protein
MNYYKIVFLIIIYIFIAGIIISLFTIQYNIEQQLTYCLELNCDYDYFNDCKDYLIYYVENPIEQTKMIITQCMLIHSHILFNGIYISLILLFEFSLFLIFCFILYLLIN